MFTGIGSSFLFSWAVYVILIAIVIFIIPFVHTFIMSTSTVSLLVPLKILWVKNVLLWPIFIVSHPKCCSPLSSSFKLFHDRGSYHIETSLLICIASQWTFFYMIGTSVMEELKHCAFTWLLSVWLSDSKIEKEGPLQICRDQIWWS